MKLSEKIILIRKKNGLSQEEFGEKINVSRQAISKWETEQTKPDIDKIKEIAKQFNVSFDYLLNDEIDTETKNVVAKRNKKTLKNVLKVTLVIIVIYLLISLYKFAVLYKFYKIADSFSENNYWMAEDFKTSEGQSITHNVTKIKNQRLEENYNNALEESSVKDENGDILPKDIQFIDSDAKIAYALTYDENEKMYIYSDMKESTVNEEEWIELLDTGKNIVKETTLSIIPSSFTDILLNSINPMCHVSMNKHEIYVNYFNRMKYQIELSDDYLVTNYSLQTEFGEKLNINISYDYVQDHFKEMDNPLETYNTMILKNKDI